MRAFALVVLAALVACSAPGPAPLDTKSESCSWCRMAISDRRFAAQLVVSGDDPRFFDDIGCLASYVRSKHDLPGGARAYVADHLTHAWLEAGAAVYTRMPALETPMGSHLLAHADAALRARDADAKDGQLLSAADVFGSALPGGGGR
jgi:copper chaperone NosL